MKILNLNNIQTLKNVFNLRIGFSDHSKGSRAATIAVAKGANVIEKHFTLNKNMRGPDHKTSLNFKEFKQYGLSDMIRSIVGTTKIALATLLITGIWYPSLVLISALLMAFMMLSAQYFHFKVNNPWQKRIPSLIFLMLCLFIAAVNLNLIA